MKKTLSVKEFTNLVEHHSISNIQEFRKRLRSFNVIENNQPLNGELVPVWEEICKVHENGVFWGPAMDQIISGLKPEIEEKQSNHSNEHQKIDSVILLLQEILVELRNNQIALKV